MDSARLEGITVSLETRGVTCSVSGRQLFVCAYTKLPYSAGGGLSNPFLSKQQRKSTHHTCKPTLPESCSVGHIKRSD